MAPANTDADAGATATAEKTRSTASKSTIKLQDNALAKGLANAYAPLLLATSMFSFKSLVADPTTALLGALLPLGILQVAFVCICLPGSNSSTLATNQKSGQRKQNVGKGDSGIGAKLVPAILSLILSLALGAPLIAITLVLFGAPFTTHQPHTLLCAAHMSLLSSLPLIYVHGVDANKWRDIAALAHPVDQVFGASLGTLVGAWAGAVPIPLDWDREWQKWPVTIVTGAYVGYVLGTYLGGYAFKGSKIKIS